MKPVARLLKYIGTDLYPKRLADEGRMSARSYSELPGGTYADTWQKVSELYTADQLREVEQQRDELLAALKWYADRYSRENGKPTVAQKAIAKVKP